jgi:hypothetical protein
VIVYTWSAGSAEGVTDSLRIARRRVAGRMRSGLADMTQIDQAQFIPGIGALAIGHQQSDGARYWTAHRGPGGRIAWRMRRRELERAAS